MVSYSKISVKMHERVKWPKTSALPPIQSMDDIYEAMEAMGIDADCDLTMYRIGEDCDLTMFHNSSPKMCFTNLMRRWSKMLLWL